MFDIKLIRDNPDAVREGLKNRRSPVDIDQVLALDARRRAAITEADALKSERNAVSKKIGELKRAGQDTSAIHAETKAIGEKIAALDAEVRALETRLRAIVDAHRAVGYDGWYTLENLVGDAYTDALRQVAVLKAWLADVAK